MEVKVSICREKCSRLTDLAECCYGNSKADVESKNSSEAAVSRSLRPLPLPAALGAISPAAGSLCKYLEAVQTVIRILVICRMWKANILVYVECLQFLISRIVFLPIVSMDLAECCHGTSKADVESQNSSEAAVNRSLRPLLLPAALGAITLLLAVFVSIWKLYRLHH